MHDALRIPELLAAIVDFVADRKIFRPDHTLYTGLTRDTYQDITALSLVGKAFRDVSLDAIWYRQTSLLPVFLAMGIVVEKQKIAAPMAYAYSARYDVVSAQRSLVFQLVHGILQTLSGSLHPDDIQHATFYTSRIREFQLPRHEVYKLINVHDPTLSLPPGSPILFPNLNMINNCTSTDKTSILRFILQSSGHRISTYSDFFPSFNSDVYIDQGSPLSSLLPSALHLTMLHLNFANKGYSTATRRALEGQICELLSQTAIMQHVRMSLDMLSPEIWQALAQQGTLRELELTSVNVHSPMPQVTFPSLEKADLLAAPVTAYVDIFQHASFPRLQKLYLTFRIRSPEDVSATASLFHAVGGSTGDLKVFNPVAKSAVVDVHVFNEELNRTRLHVSNNILRPLLRYSNMRQLKLFAAWPIVYDDTFIKDLSQAFPNLEQLTMHARGFYLPQSPTLGERPLECLRFLACPRLQTLGIDVDTSTFTSQDPPNEIITSQNCSLVELNVFDSAIEDAATERVATFLQAVFPALQTVHPGFPSASMLSSDSSDLLLLHRSRWSAVSQLLLKRRGALAC